MKHVLLGLLSGLLLYGVSFAAYALPSVHSFIFWAVVGWSMVLTWRDWRWGFVALLAELVLGGMGHLLFVNLYGVTISIRIALFIVVGCALFYRLVAYKLWKQRLLYIPLVCWGGALVLGGVVGIIHGNDLASLWGDANGYVFWLLVFTGIFLILRGSYPEPFYSSVVAVLMGSWVASIVLHGGLVYVFTHTTFEPFVRALPALYDWVRDHRLGEITRAPGGFMRVFLQGQIMSVLACALFLLLTRGRKRIFGAGLALAVLMTSFSRSFWVGVFGFMLCAPLCLLGVNYQWRTKVSFWARCFGATIAGAAIAVAVVFFPLPPPSVDNMGRALGSRFQDGEAVASRWSLLPKMIDEITARPLLGSGLGARITYKSYDPRITTTTADGTYTTYAFEWGYADFLLKFGLAGTILLVSGLWIGLRNVQCTPVVYAALMPLWFVHMFTPYLNHPLGYGYIAIALLTVRAYSVQTVSDAH